MRRQIERDFPFVEVYQGVVEKLRERKYLSVREMSQLIECIKSPEQAGRCLDIISGYMGIKAAIYAQADSMDAMLPMEPAMASSSGQAEAEAARWLQDWPTRKRFLARIAEIAILELGRPDLAFAIIANWQRFKLSTYFGKDLILQLGEHGNIPLDLLGEVVKIVQQQLGPTSRGSRAALEALLQVSQDRGSGVETITTLKKQLAALRKQAQPPAPGLQVLQPVSPVPVQRAAAPVAATAAV